MKTFLACALSLYLLAATAGRQNKNNADEAEVRQALTAFIQAFDNLEWDKFRSFFADDATVFYPRQFPERAQGRAEFESGFRKIFEQIRAGRTIPPYMDIQPRNFQLQMTGGVAIATFHLDDRPGFLNRRTIVLARFGHEWKIIHLHASEVAVSERGSPTITCAK